MFEDRYILEVVLQLPEETDPDGGVHYRNVPGRALMLESSEWNSETGGGVADRRTFLLRCGEPPEVGARIGLDQEFFTIRQVRACRDLAGRIECYRCTVA